MAFLWQPDSHQAPPRPAPRTSLQAAAVDPPRHQQCALCLESYQSPRILPCFHTFCLPCLEQLVWSNYAAASFSCPTCRAAVQVPSGGVGKFQVNFYVEAAMENLQIRDGGNTRVCDMCGEGNATSKCVDCNQFACDNCTKVHARISATKSHTILNLNAQSQDNPVVKERFCTTHTDEKIRFFCTQCRTVLCRDCKLTSHEGHSTTDLSQRSQKAKQMLLDVAKKSRNMTPKLKTSLQKAEKCKQDLAVKKTHILATFRARADEIRKMIDFCLQQAEQNLNSKSGKLEKELTQTVENMQQQIASLDSLCDHLEQVARVGCDADVLSLPEQMVTFFGCDKSRVEQSFGVSPHFSGLGGYNYQSNQPHQAVNMQGAITAPFEVFTKETWCKEIQLHNVTTHPQVFTFSLEYRPEKLKEMISEKIGNVSVISVGHREPLHPQERALTVWGDVQGFQQPLTGFSFAQPNCSSFTFGFPQSHQQPLTGAVSKDIADIQSVISSWLKSG